MTKQELNISKPGERFAAIDVLRGLVMVLMALDHVRDYYGDITIDPHALATTTPLLFATRWVTHFCAPVFVFLAGVGAYLYAARRTRAELSRFLVTRGIWLIFLEFTIIFFAWLMTFGMGWVFLQVIAAIGFAMVFLAAAIHLPGKIQLALGLAIVCLHNLLDGSGLASSGNLGALAYGGPSPQCSSAAARASS